MKKSISLLSVLALGACVYGTPINNEGFYTEMDLATIDWSAVNKSGHACQTNLFGLIPFGDNSLPTAVKNAKIEKLAYVDTDYALYFPILSRDCTNVWGMGYGVPAVTLPTVSEPVATEKTDTKPAEKSVKNKSKSKK